MVTPNFRAPPKVFITVLISQLIRQYFTRQLVQVSLFANILPLQNFPMYGMQVKSIRVKVTLLLSTHITFAYKLRHACCFVYSRDFINFQAIL